MKEKVINQSDAGTNRTKNKETGMNSKFGRRVAVASVAALSAGGLMLGLAASASASAFEPVQGNVGIYNGTNLSSGKIGIPDLAPGDVVVVQCWGRGQNVRAGNVWYRVTGEIYNHLGGATATQTGWIYGADTDGNDAFHRGDFPAC